MPAISLRRWGKPIAGMARSYKREKNNSQQPSR